MPSEDDNRKRRAEDSEDGQNKRSRLDLTDEKLLELCLANIRAFVESDPTFAEDLLKIVKDKVERDENACRASQLLADQAALQAPHHGQAQMSPAQIAQILLQAVSTDPINQLPAQPSQVNQAPGAQGFQANRNVNQEASRQIHQSGAQLPAPQMMNPRGNQAQNARRALLNAQPIAQASHQGQARMTPAQIAQILLQATGTNPINQLPAQPSQVNQAPAEERTFIVSEEVINLLKRQARKDQSKVRQTKDQAQLLLEFLVTARLQQEERYLNQREFDRIVSAWQQTQQANQEASPQRNAQPNAQFQSPQNPRQGAHPPAHQVGQGAPVNRAGQGQVPGYQVQQHDPYFHPGAGSSGYNPLENRPNRAPPPQTYQVNPPQILQALAPAPHPQGALMNLINQQEPAAQGALGPQAPQMNLDIGNRQGSAAPGAHPSGAQLPVALPPAPQVIQRAPMREEVQDQERTDSAESGDELRVD